MVPVIGVAVDSHHVVPPVVGSHLFSALSSLLPPWLPILSLNTPQKPHGQWYDSVLFRLKAQAHLRIKLTD